MASSRRNDVSTLTITGRIQGRAAHWLGDKRTVCVTTTAGSVGISIPGSSWPEAALDSGLELVEDDLYLGYLQDGEMYFLQVRANQSTCQIFCLMLEDSGMTTAWSAQGPVSA